MIDLKDTLQRLTGIDLLRDGIAKIYEFQKTLETYIKEKFMSLEESIERLEALSEATATAVTTEASQAKEVVAAKDKAIAEALATVEELKAQLASAGLDPALAARLDGIADRFQTSVGDIGEIFESVNLTPVSDLVVSSVQSDSSPTPEAVQSISVAANVQTPVQAATSAVEAIGDALENVFSEV